MTSEILSSFIIYTNNMLITEKLCYPALVNLVLSILGYLYLIYRTLTAKSYCVGNYKCGSATYNNFTLIIEFIFIIFWTWILNTLCNRGYVNVAWFLVLFPFIFFILFLIFLTTLVAYK